MEGSPIHLPAHLIHRLASHGQIEAYATGELLVTEGDLSNSLYVLLSGRLHVFTFGPKGRELVYNVLLPGEFFGEMSLDGEPRSASVRATERSECLVISAQAARATMHAVPEFAECLLVKLIALVRHSTKQVKTIAMDGVYERTVALLDEVAISDGTSLQIPGSITQTEIASRIGATREMVGHVLRDLVRGGYIFKASRKFTIIKPLPKRW